MGLGHQINMFLKAYKIKPVLSVHAQMVFKLFCKHLLILKIVPKAAQNLIGRFLPVYIHGRFSKQFSVPQVQLLKSQSAISASWSG